ncbi:MAG: hypothetical protein ACI9LM_002801 [Alteromonadaceae bacterium]
MIRYFINKHDDIGGKKTRLEAIWFIRKGKNPFQKLSLLLILIEIISVLTIKTMVLLFGTCETKEKTYVKT